jgi:hypothetical protein
MALKEYLSYIDSILLEPSTSLYSLYKEWGAHYISDNLKNEIYEIYISKNQAWWCVRSLNKTKIDPVKSEKISEYYLSLIRHLLKYNNKIVLHCKIRWENKHNTHSNALVFTKNEITNELNLTLVEPNKKLCYSFVRLIRKFVSSLECNISLVAANSHLQYATYLRSLGFFEYPVCRHLTLFLAYRLLHRKNIQYTSLSDLKKELHKPFNIFCKKLLFYEL